MAFKLYLIAPESESAHDYMRLSGPDAGGPGITRSANLGIATVAALAPQEFEIELCDEAVEPVNFETDADAIGISSNVSQSLRALHIGAEFRRRGKTTIIGGPHVSLAPELFADRFDCRFVGELEPVAAQFFDDLRSGRLRRRYDGGKAEMSTSPRPRWDLYPNERALMGVVQTSRGCPFECEFCDVIQYLGRVQRHKTNGQVVDEVQKLYDLGYGLISLADDNFTVYRKRAKSLLAALRTWNGSDGRDYVRFATQMSIDVARDEEVLRLCAEAGLHNAFIGIETINEDSLRESKKRQNLAIDLAGRIGKIARAGLRVEAALMLGFDHDGLDIFERQYAFASGLPVANFNISVLVAPAATPLYERMRQAGRIVGDRIEAQFPSNNLLTNIEPAQMTRHQLQVGTRWLISRLMHPAAFERRMELIAELTGPNPLAARGTGRMYRHPSRQLAERRFASALRELTRSDAGTGRAIRNSLALARRRPEIRDTIADAVTDYAMRFLSVRRNGTYDAAYAEMARPPIERSPEPRTPAWTFDGGP